MNQEETLKNLEWAANRQGAVIPTELETTMHLIAIVREQSEEIGRLRAEIDQLKSTASSAMVSNGKT